MPVAPSPRLERVTEVLRLAKDLSIPKLHQCGTGRLTGAKPFLRPKHVWAVRTRLQLANRLRDLTLFDLAIDSKLRGRDVVALKVVDMAPHGYAVDRASVRQRKTGRPVRFEIAEQTRQGIDDYLLQPRRLPQGCIARRPAMSQMA